MTLAVIKQKINLKPGSIGIYPVIWKSYLSGHVFLVLSDLTCEGTTVYIILNLLWLTLLSTHCTGHMKTCHFRGAGYILWLIQ